MSTQRSDQHPEAVGPRMDPRPQHSAPSPGAPTKAVSDTLPEDRYQLRGKHILLISGEPWEGLHMSKHHLAEELARRGNSVTWLDPPVNDAGNMTIEVVGPVHRVRYRHRLRGVNNMPAFVRNWYYDRLLRRIETMRGQPIDLIWCFDSSRLGRFPGRGRFGLFHPVDLRVLPGSEGLVRTADLVLTVASPIAAALRTMQPRSAVQLIGHALDLRWTTALPASTERHERPRVMCAGNMSMPMLDWELLYTEASDHPGADFHFIGPYDPTFPDPWAARARDLPNTTLHGLLDKEAMVPLLASADVLLVCYRADLYPDDVSNSHKVLEYLATGKCVVASWTADYQHEDVPMLMARERWQHRDLLRTALGALDVQNDVRSRSQRIAYAHARTIHHRVDQMERYIAEAVQLLARTV